MSQRQPKRRTVSAEPTPILSMAKRLRLEKEQQLEQGDMEQLSVDQFDSAQIYELLLSHGLPVGVCDTLRERQLDGVKFAALFNQISSARATVNEQYGLETTTTTTWWRHFESVLNRYSANKYPSRSKIFCDSAHGQIPVHPLLCKIIDTKQFQRLRCLKQLGTLCWVYPCANHTRFEHSIGTSHLAGMLIKHLKENQPSLGITLGDELCVKIAGLCHDLGHGPFSHMFEDVIENLGLDSSVAWKHEQATLMLIDKMLADNPSLRQDLESYGLFDGDIQFIKDLIYNPTLKSPIEPGFTYEDKLIEVESLKARGLSKSFMFEIVNNYRSGIDVDKFDYFNRDCMHLGFTNNFNYQRYIMCTRVIKDTSSPHSLNRICVRDKEVNNLYEMYHVRELLTRRAYKHETGFGINLMVTEALQKANAHYNFGNLFNQGMKGLADYEKLTDGIFYEILDSSVASLAESRQILERVQRRDLYKFVASLVVTSQGIDKCDIEEAYSYFVEQSAAKINKSNIKLELVKFNYGTGNKNPLESVRFFNMKSNPNHAFPILKHNVAYMLTDVFEDVQLRVYSRCSEAAFVREVNRLFTDWAKKRDLNEPLFGASSPKKSQ